MSGAGFKKSYQGDSPDSLSVSAIEFVTTQWLGEEKLEEDPFMLKNA